MGWASGKSLMRLFVFSRVVVCVVFFCVLSSCLLLTYLVR